MSQPNALAHQFHDIEQQQEASSLGMWVFLVTEVMFFGGLIMAYTFAHWSYPEGFAAASHRLYLHYGGVNTALLLGSSFTMALGVRAAQMKQQQLLIRYLVTTCLLGCFFLGIKGFEYHQDYLEHLVPGNGFQFEERNLEHAELFFWLYFALTGLHALHVIIGIGVITTISVMIRVGRLSDNSQPVEVVGLYWHFVDIVWVFLFPLLYLIGHR